MDAVFLHSCVTETPRLFRNIGPYQLAWYLRQHDYSAQVIDFIHLMDRDQLMAAIRKFVTPETKILGWSFMGFLHISFWWYKQVIDEILPEIKKEFPNLKIVTGGSGAYDTCRVERNKKVFDYFFFGHAEDTMLAVMNSLCRGGPTVPFEIVHGNKVIRENTVLPVSDSKKFDICTCNHRWSAQDCIQPKESLPIEISRGCIFKCKFCRYPYIGKVKNDFTRNMEEIGSEMQYNFDKWGVQHYYMLEDTFNDRNDKLQAFSDMIKQLPFKIGYSCYLRPDLLWSNPHQPQLLEETGLVGAFLGIESFGEESSQSIGKGWSSKHGKAYMLELLNNIWQRRVPFKASMIVGIPPDTKEFLLESNQWLVDNEIMDWTWHALSVNRDINGPWVSDFDRNADKYGFEWINKNGKTIWKTKYMDWFEALDLKDQMNEVGKQYRTVDCWNVLERGSVGYDPFKDRYTLLKNIDHKESADRRNIFLKNYLKDLMNL